MKKTLLIGLSVLGLSACGPRGNQPNVELIQDMMEQPAVKAQRYDPWFKDGISSLVPPSKTAPVGFQPYAYATDVLAAEKELKNPLAGNQNPEVLLVGQKFYNTNCMVCHGQGGKGDGAVASKYPSGVPALVSDKVRAWPDSHIYHVITMGQGLMGPYASHIPQKYRWQVVNYVRHLQQEAK